MPRTDRRPRQRLDAGTRRAAILAAAIEAFSHAPYDQVSVAAVARTAGASEALVHRYFTGKSGLYRAAVETALATLLERQAAADAALGSTATARQRIATSLDVYLDFVAERAVGWAAPLRAPGASGDSAAELRDTNRRAYLAILRDLLGLPGDDPAVGYALAGYLGFVDASCLAWVEAGCRHQHRRDVIDSALGALTGALTAAGHRCP